MTEQEDRDAEQDEGPGSAYKNYTLMEELLDKLKLLKYDQGFLKKSASHKPMSKHYFATATNPGEQFFMFTSLSAWLIQKSGNTKFETPQEHDDPNALISNILGEMRRLDTDVDFPPNRLKNGAGEHCLRVLNGLADAALKRTEFTWMKAAPRSEDQADDLDAAADESELTAEQFQELEEEPELAEDEDEEAYVDLATLGNISAGELSVPQEKREILQSDVAATDWRLELERVTPSLKIVLRPDAKDWRMHIEQMQQYRNGIDDQLKQAHTHLDRLANDIGKTLEKVSSRERYLNTQLESLLSQFRSSQDRLAEVKERYKEASVGVTERSRLLQQLTDELEQIKQEMEERGVSLTDGAPLVKVKQAITKIQMEIVAMDVQTGVIEQGLLQAQLRDRTYLHHDMHAVSGVSDDFAY